MDSTVLLLSLGMMAARCTDASLGTLRTVSIIQGRRTVAWGLGFIEILIWIFAVSRVIKPARYASWHLLWRTAASVAPQWYPQSHGLQP